MNLRKTHQTGFTLVEVLIAMAVLSLLLSLLSASFFSLVRSTNVLSVESQQLDELRAPRYFLTGLLEDMTPLAVRKNNADLVYLFNGEENELRFVGQLPAHRGGGGLHFLQLSMKSTNTNDTALVLWDTPAWTVEEFDVGSQVNTWRESELLNDISTLTFSYYGRIDEQASASWHPTWQNQAQLPELIKIDIQHSEGRHWPAMTLPIHSQNAASKPYLVWSQ